MKRLLALLPLPILVACGSNPPAPAQTTPPVASTTPIASATTPAVTPPASDAPKKLAELRDRLLDEWLRDEPGWGRSLGLHEYDGKVGDYAAAALTDRIARMTNAKKSLDAIDARALSADDALDLELLKEMAEQDLFTWVDMNDPQKKPQFYEDLFTVNPYIDRDYAPIETRKTKLVEHEEASLKQTAHFYENIKLPISKPVAEVAAKNYAGFATYLRGDVVKVMAKVGDAQLKARFAKSNEALAKEADKISAWLKKEAIPKGDSSHVLGVERYKKLLLVQEGLTTPLEEFKKMGEENLAANKAAFEELAKTTTPARPKAKDLIATATTIMDASRKFIVDKKIVTLASTDDAKVKETPPYARWNSASLDASGPFDNAKSAFYYVTLPDPSWPKKEQEEYVMTYGTLLTTTVHEVYPGHFVQGRWIEKAPSRVQKMMASYSFIEGWAHYVEQMMIEEGFRVGEGEKMDRESKLGQLSDALLRNCRFVASIGIHTEGMTLEQAEKRFINDCHIDKAEAREQAVRGTFDPGYFAYTLGKIEILALREEAKKKLGDKFSLEKFHDALLAHGSPPVALIRERVLKELAE